MVLWLSRWSRVAATKNHFLLQLLETPKQYLGMGLLNLNLNFKKKNLEKREKFMNFDSHLYIERYVLEYAYNQVSRTLTKLFSSFSL